MECLHPCNHHLLLQPPLRQHVFRKISANLNELELQEPPSPHIYLNPQVRNMEPPPQLTLDEIDRRSGYRVGWPRLTHAPVLTMPVGQEDSSSPSVDVDRLRPQIHQILARNQIVSDRFALEYRMPMHSSTRDPPRKFKRLVIECDYDPRKQEEHTDSWAIAVIEIRNLLLESNPNQPELLDLGIELYDPLYEASIHPTNIAEKYQHVVQNWDGGENYRRKVLALFENRPTLWQVMLLTGLRADNRHTKDEKCVLWFDAIDASNTLWLEVEKELESIFPRDVSIEIWQASGGLLSVAFSGTEHFKDSFAFPPNPGSSIGEVGREKATGTFGGYVTVEKTKVDAHGKSTRCEHVYALTCAHVALGRSRLVQGIPSEIQKLESIQVQSPSLDDCIQSIERAEEYVTARQSRIDDCETYISRQRDRNNVEAIERLCRLRDTAASDIDIRKEIINLASGNRVLGRVKAAVFGGRTHENEKFKDNLAMDLALIDVTDLNVKPEDCLFLGDLPFVEDSNDLFGTWETVNSSRRIASREEVWKVGRTTGVTKGYLHDIKADVKFILDHERHIHNTFSAYVVGAEMDDEPVDIQTKAILPFVRGGDSGAFVFSKVDQSPKSGHRVIGLLFGTSSSLHFSYFIPFDAVIAEIEALTGGKVIWPVKCG